MPTSRDDERCVGLRGVTDGDNRQSDVKVALSGVEIAYQTTTGELVAVQDANLAVKAGEFVTIVGPSGCGKSTLLKSIGGLVPHTSGTINVAANETPASGPAHVEHSIVFQEPRLLPWRDTLGNVVFPLESRHVSKRERRQRALTELKRVGLARFAHMYPPKLSGGMQQRVNLARALAVDPEVLLLDEPFAALDAQTREQMQQELLTIWETRRKTAIFVTHQVDEAIFLADRVVVMTKGPGTVKHVTPVPFGRPRDLRLKRTAEFHQLEDEIWSSIDVVPLDDNVEANS